MKGIPSAQSWCRIQLRLCHWSDTHMGWRPLVTAITPFCKAGHGTKQFSCLHPLTAKEAAKNWFYPAVSWQRAQRNLATSAALETCPATHNTCFGNTSPAFTAMPGLLQCVTPRWEPTKPFYQELLGSHLPLICIWDLSLKDSGSTGFTCQSIGLDSSSLLP